MQGSPVLNFPLLGSIVAPPYDDCLRKNWQSLHAVKLLVRDSCHSNDDCMAVIEGEPLYRRAWFEVQSEPITGALVQITQI